MTAGAPDKQIALRRAMVTALLLTTFALLAARLAWIQCAQRPQWDALASRYHQERRPIQARRGMILDCRGRRLALSIPATSIGINPRALDDDEKPRAARLLAGVLRLSSDDILERLQKPRYFVWLKRRVTTAEEEAVRRLEMSAIEFRQEALRVYPHGSLAAHVLGAAGIDGQGLAGVELSLDKHLAGHPGSELLFRDGLGRLVVNSPSQSVPPADGRDIILTIDANIQRIAEEELAGAIEKWNAAGGAIVVLEAGTSRILAMASAPTFDPNRFAEASDNQRLNRAIGAVFEPGSTFKSFTAAAALDGNLVQPDTEFNCHNGAHAFGRRILHDDHPSGILSFRDVIVNSSNIGVAQIAALLGPSVLRHAIVRFGFGGATGVELPGEENGILRPLRQWTSYSMTSLPMGQEIAVTTLGMAAGYNVFASKGAWRRPTLVAGFAGAGGKAPAQLLPPSPAQPAIRPSIAALMANDILASVVERGTGKRAQIPGYAVAGKTGTAQVARKDGRGYEPGAYMSSFAALAPADDPKIVCVVTIERPRKAHYGGTVAAPATAAVIERALTYLGVPRRQVQVAVSDGSKP